MPEMSETAIATDAPPPWRATLLTLFPEMFPGPLGHSLAGKALRAGRWTLDLVQIRDFGLGKQAQVDDEPFGGHVEYRVRWFFGEGVEDRSLYRRAQPHTGAQQQ